MTFTKTLSHDVVASLIEPDGWPTVKTIASILLSQSAFDCSEDFSSEARANVDLSQPRASISTSIVPLCPDPGLPMFTRLPFKSIRSRIPESALATTVKGSG